MPETIFDLPYRILTFLGLWALSSPSPPPSLRLLYHLYQSWAFLYISSLSACLFWDLYYVRHNVHKVSTNLSTTISVLILLWKNVCGLNKFRVLRRLQERLNGGLCPRERQRDRRIIRKATRDMKLSCWAVYLLGVCTMTTWLSSGLLRIRRDEEDNLPLPLYVPWDHHQTPLYEVSVGLQVYGGYFCTIDVLSFNLAIFGTIVQICAEFDILLKNTEAIKEWYGKLEGGRGRPRLLNEEENREMKRMLVYNIRHHQRIIHCVDESENSYSPMMVVQFVGSMILITFISLDLILVTRELNSRVYPLIIFLALAVSDIYLFCHFGSRLIYKSHDLLCSLYEMPWEAMDSSNRHVILMMMIKAQRPPKLTIQKFANIDFYSLLWLCKITYNTLYLLLHLTKEKQ